MPPLDPAAQERIRQKQSMPQPSLPSAGIPSLPTGPSPERQLEETRRRQQMQNDAEANARARAAAEIAAAREVRDARKDARDAKALELTGGAQPRETEQRNIGLVTSMAAYLKRIQETYRAHPEAVKPGIGETIGNAVAGDGTGVKNIIGKGITYYTTPKDTLEARQVIKQNLESFTQAAIYSASGAAFQDPEFQRNWRNNAPDIFDTDASLKDKQAKMATELEAALLRTGAGRAQIDQAILGFIKSTNDVYNRGAWGGPKSPDEATGKNALGVRLEAGIRGVAGSPDLTQDIPLNLPKPPSETTTFFEQDGQKLGDEVKPGGAPPEAMQQQYAQWVASKGGLHKITPEEYIQFRQELDKQYFPDAQPLDYDQVKTFLDGYKTPGGTQNLTIPPTSEKPLDDSLASRGANFGLSEKERAGLTASDIGAGIIGAANAGGFGVPEMLAPNGTFKALQQEHPKSMEVGDIVGSVAPVMGAVHVGEAGLAKLLKGMDARDITLISELLANSGYAGERSAARGEGGAEILGNAALGGIGALGATGIASGSRGLMGGERRAALDTLHTAPEFDPTTLQAMGLGKAEEVLQGLPFVRGARAKAAESFNRAEAGNVLRNLDPEAKVSSQTPAGSELADQVYTVLDQGYKALTPQISGSFDSTFQRGMAALRLSVTGTPSNPAPKIIRQLWKDEILPITQTFQGSRFDGENFLAAYRKLRDLGENWRSVTGETTVDAPKYHEMARLTDKLRAQMVGQIERIDPVVAERLRALNKAWASNVRVQRAVKSGLAHGEGVYSPGQKIQAITALDTSANKNMSVRGKALDQKYASAASKIMGSEKVPEKVNLSQLGWTYFGGALASNGMLPAILTSAQFLAYTPGVKKIVQAMLAGKRPSAADNKLVRAALANYIRTQQLPGGGDN